MKYKVTKAQAIAIKKYLAKTTVSKKGQTWDTKQLQKEFTVDGFSMGMVVVTRKKDGVQGSMEFDHSPRVYYNFIPA